jgi:uncharacterized membrane protein YphA (DoxX/SURF4 family)
MALSRIIVALIFLLSAGFKLSDYKAFVRSVGAYRLTNPARWTSALSASIIVVEGIVGAALLSGWQWRRVAAAAVGLLCVFSWVVAAALLRGLTNIKCGCMVLGRNGPIGWYVCLRNLGLACLLLPSLVSSRIGVLAFLCAGGLLVASFLSIDAGKARTLTVRS